MKTPITQEQWQTLKPGDKIMDSLERVWNITARDWNHNPDRLFAQCPGYEEERLDWRDGQILDEEWGIIIELNHSSVKII